MYGEYITGFEPPTFLGGLRHASLRGVGYKVCFFDLLPVDVRYSKDGKSFDAQALCKLYTQAFLEHGLATLRELRQLGE